MLHFEFLFCFLQKRKEECVNLNSIYDSYRKRACVTEFCFPFCHRKTIPCKFDFLQKKRGKGMLHFEFLFCFLQKRKEECVNLNSIYDSYRKRACVTEFCFPFCHRKTIPCKFDFLQKKRGKGMLHFEFLFCFLQKRKEECINLNSIYDSYRKRACVTEFCFPFCCRKNMPCKFDFTFW